MKKIKVLVVDDSAVIRQTLNDILSEDPHIEVMATAADPYYAAEKIKKQVPDVITLDIEMPRMDGLTFLRKIMTQHPIPTVIISSVSTQGSQTALKALELGAVEIITKPQMHSKEFILESSINITDAVKAAASASLSKLKKRVKVEQVEPKYSADVIIPQIAGKSMIKTTEKVVAIGASTGGTEALKEILVKLPHDTPGIVVVQHMPEVFTKSYAKRLNEICKIAVKEAEDNDTIIRGRALVAPGNYHMLVKRSGARYFVNIKQGPLVNRHRPSVDVLFRSTAHYAGNNSVGIILTGMGDDGAKGLLEMKKAAAETYAQNEESCVVFGMPKEAIRLNATDKAKSLEEISSIISKIKE